MGCVLLSSKGKHRSMSDTEDYLPRHLIPELEDAIASARVVNLIGPRQVGKTTLVRDLFGNGRFITLDDVAVLAAIEADPEGQLTSLMENLDQAPLILDEAQRSKKLALAITKKLALAIKGVVDTNRRKGQLVLTGSSNVFTITDVADSLAGRMRTLKLWPLSVAEVKRARVSRPRRIIVSSVNSHSTFGNLCDRTILRPSGALDRRIILKFAKR
jgi:predicted AAA+ superfamily ATPase